MHLTSSDLQAEKLSTVDEYGTRHVLPGEHTLVFSRGHGPELVEVLQVEIMPKKKKRLVISTMAGLFGQTESDLGLGYDEL